MNKPDFKQMSYMEACELFLEIRKDFVLYLNSFDFSQREISRRMGGSSVRAVNEILQEEKHES